MGENLSYIFKAKLLLLVLLSNNIVFFNTFQTYFAKTSKTKLRIIQFIINFIWNLNYRDVIIKWSNLIIFVQYTTKHAFFVFKVKKYRNIML